MSSSMVSPGLVRLTRLPGSYMYFTYSPGTPKASVEVAVTIKPRSGVGAISEVKTLASVIGIPLALNSAIVDPLWKFPVLHLSHSER